MISIRQVDLFYGLTDEQVLVLESLSTKSTCWAGERLFNEGDRAEHVFILLKGKVSIKTRVGSTPREVTIAILNQPGRVIGWSGLMSSDRYYSAAAQCDEDSTLLIFDGEAFSQALKDDPQMGFIIMRRIADVISTRLRNIQQVVLKTL